MKIRKDIEDRGLKCHKKRGICAIIARAVQQTGSDCLGSDGKGRFRYAEGRTGHEKIVVTVIGADRVGIVAGVTKELAKENINILDISQTILDGIFDMVLICDMENAKGSLKQVQDDMGELGRELGVDVRVQLADIFYAMHRI